MNQVELSSAPTGGATANDVTKDAVNKSDAAGSNNDLDHVPQTFNKDVQYWLSCLGFAVGFGNVWRFPYLCYKSGGAVFLIPYGIALMCLAVPLYMIETSYGQLLRCKLHQRFSIISPKFWALSHAQILIGWLTTIYYITLMAWSFAYFFASFKSPLPWITGKEGQDSENLWNSDYFYKDVIKMSPGIEKTGGLVWWLVFCLFLSYLATYFAAFKGLKSIGNAVYFTVLMPYVILTIFLIRGVTLPGAGEGLKYLFKPDFSKLWNINVWVDAVQQILFSSGVSYGPLMYYGTARKPDEKILKASYLVPMMNSATSLYAALGMFAFLGHVAQELNLPVDKVSTSGLDLAFVAYPGMVNMLAGSNFWAIIFFMMLVTLGIDSVFGFVDHIVNFMIDQFPAIRQKMSYEAFTALFLTFSFLCSCIFVLESGLYTFALFDTYSCYISLFTCILIELALIPWVFGIDKLSTLLEARTGEVIPSFVRIFVKYLIPIYIFAIYIMAWVREFQKDAQSDEDNGMPYGFLWLGRLIMFAPMIAILVGLLVKFETPDIHTLIEKQYGMSFNSDGQLNKVASIEDKKTEKNGMQ